MCSVHSSLFKAVVASCLGAGSLWSQAPAPPLLPPPLSRLSPLTDAPSWSRLADYSRVLTAEEFDNVFNSIYTDARNLPPPWQRDSGGIAVPTGAVDGSKMRIEFRLAADKAAEPPHYWRRVSELPPLEGKPVLSGMKIALDPGHIGGAFAHMEERYLTFHPNEYVAEGELSLTVAQLIKPRLEALGAMVTLVRDKNEPVTTARPEDMRVQAEGILKANGISSPKDSYSGMTGDEKMLTVQWQSEKMFYRESEIRARGKKVNEQLKPDLVLCLHFNAAPWGPAGNQQASVENHLHVLVNGCYAPVELQLQDVRFEMLQRLFLRVHDEELPLAEQVAKAMAQSTGLPPYVYVTPNARLAAPSGYVYARNLLANRIYQCPVIYLEPYVMNNAEVYQRLVMGQYAGRTLLNGALRTSIFEDYAQGIVEGLKNYYRQKRKP